MRLINTKWESGSQTLVDVQSPDLGPSELRRSQGRVHSAPLKDIHKLLRAADYACVAGARYIVCSSVKLSRYGERHWSVGERKTFRETFTS